MWQRVRMAASVMCLLTGAATVAFAQGSMTQDPGRLAPGNLGAQQLGPSVNVPNSNRTGPGEGAPVFRGAPRPDSSNIGVPGYGSNWGGVGAGTGGFGGYSNGGDLSRGIGPGR
jgi:hypothetical protein